MASAGGAQSTPVQRWLARLSFLLAGLAIVVLVVFAGLKSLAMFAIRLAAAVMSVAAAYFFLSRRGVVRWLSLGVFVLVPIVVIVVFAVGGVLWVAVVSAGLWLLAAVTARQALTGDRPDWRMPEYPAQPSARHPYLIMNPKSGGGKVEKFDLKKPLAPRCSSSASPGRSTWPRWPGRRWLTALICWGWPAVTAPSR